MKVDYRVSVAFFHGIATRGYWFASDHISGASPFTLDNGKGNGIGIIGNNGSGFLFLPWTSMNISA